MYAFAYRCSCVLVYILVESVQRRVSLITDDPTCCNLRRFLELRYKMYFT